MPAIYLLQICQPSVFHKEFSRNFKLSNDIFISNISVMLVFLLTILFCMVPGHWIGICYLLQSLIVWVGKRRVCLLFHSACWEQHVHPQYTLFYTEWPWQLCCEILSQKSITDFEENISVFCQEAHLWGSLTETSLLWTVWNALLTRVTRFT